MPRSALLLFALLSCWGPAASAADGEPLFAVSQVRATPDVRDVVTDAQGFLWAASAQGVCRHDGTTWRCPTSERAWALAPAGAGRIWALLQDGGLMELSEASAVRRPWSTATAVARGRTLVAFRGALYLGGADGLFAVPSEGGCSSNGACEGRRLSGEPIVAAASNDTQLAVASRDGLWIVGENGEPRRLWRSAHSITAMGAMRDGAWVVATEGADLQVVGRDGRPIRRSSAPFDEVRAVGESPRGELWLATSSGVLRVSADLATISPIRGFPSTDARTLTFDEQGGVWVGTAREIVRVQDRALMRLVGIADGLGSEVVFAVDRARDGAIALAGTDGVALYDGRRFRTYGLFDGLEQLDVRGIADGEEGLLASGLASGLHRIAGDRVVAVDLGTRRRSIITVRARRQGGYWVAWLDGGLSVYSRGKLREVIAPSADAGNRIHDLVEDQRGRVWLSFAKDGLGLLTNERLETFARGELDHDVDMLGLMIDGDDVYAGTSGAGLLRFRAGAVRAVSTAEGLFDASVHALICDDRKNVWISTAAAIGYVPLAELRAAFDERPRRRLRPTMYDASDGVLGAPVRAFSPTVARAPDGKLLFATLKGLLVVDPAQASESHPPAMPLIEDWSVNGTSERPGVVAKTGRLYDVRFAVAVPYFVAPTRLRILHRLDGVDTAWRETTQDRRIAYDRLPPGAYAIRVLAEARGAPPREASMRFELPIPWFASWRFRAPAALIVVALLLLAYRARVRRGEAVAAAVLFDRARIARDIHDSLEQDLAGLRLQMSAARATLEQGDSHRASEHLSTAGDLVSDAIEDLRHSIWGLRVPIATSDALAEVLGTRMQRAVAGLAIRVEVRSLGPSRRLASQLLTHVLSIAREAVANALKHASPSLLAVELDLRHPDWLVLRVEDDGAPQGGDARGSGSGQLGMQARAAALGGTLTVRPRSPQGTILELRTPTGRKRGWRLHRLGTTPPSNDS